MKIWGPESQEFLIFNMKILNKFGLFTESLEWALILMHFYLQQMIQWDQTECIGDSLNFPETPKSENF